MPEDRLKLLLLFFDGSPSIKTHCSFKKAFSVFRNETQYVTHK